MDSVSDRPRRTASINTNYRELAGMSKAGSVGGKSTKSVKSTKSKMVKSKKPGMEAEELDECLEQVDKDLQENLTFLSKVMERRQRLQGDVFEMEAPITQDLSDNRKFQEVRDLHLKELDVMKQREVSLQ